MMIMGRSVRRVMTISLLMTAYLFLCGFAYKSSNMKFVSQDAPTMQGIVIPQYSEVIRLSKGTVLYKNAVYNVEDSFLTSYDNVKPDMFAAGLFKGNTVITDNGTSVVFVGDSRIMSMSANNKTNAVNKTQQMKLQRSISWVGEGGAGLSWFNDIAFPTLDTNGGYKGKVIVFSLGVNDVVLSKDVEGVKRTYKEEIAFLANRWQGSILCVTTVNPIEGPLDSKFNKKIESFNSMIRNELPATVHVIDGAALCDTVIPREYLDTYHFGPNFDYAMESFYYNEAVKAASGY